MASKRRLRRRQRERKVTHRTEAAAIIAKKKLGQWDVFPYRCDFCGLFHLGRRPARVRQSIQAARQAKGPRSMSAALSGDPR